MSRSNDNRELIRQLKHGEAEAADRLVELYGARLHVAARLLCGNEADAQDLAAETLHAALFSIGSYREASSFFSWLYGILLNLHRMSARKRLRSRVVYTERLPRVPAGGPAVGHALDSEVLSDRLAGAIAKLPPAHQDVVLLRYFGELKIHEVADRLGLRPGTVKSRLFHALQQLRAHLPREMNLFG
jgi:RNA polymerase sigma-70 factor (ECF subfamily)